MSWVQRPDEFAAGSRKRSVKSGAAQNLNPRDLLTYEPNGGAFANHRHKSVEIGRDPAWPDHIHILSRGRRRQTLRYADYGEL